jgi:hypothetical protein
MSKLVKITVGSTGETTEVYGELYEVTLSHSPFSDGFIELSIYKDDEKIFSERRDSWDPFGIIWREKDQRRE